MAQRRIADRRARIWHLQHPGLSCRDVVCFDLDL